MRVSWGSGWREARLSGGGGQRVAAARRWPGRRLPASDSRRGHLQHLIQCSGFCHKPRRSQARGTPINPQRGTLCLRPLSCTALLKPSALPPHDNHLQRYSCGLMNFAALGIGPWCGRVHSTVPTHSRFRAGPDPFPPIPRVPGMAPTLAAPLQQLTQQHGGLVDGPQRVPSSGGASNPRSSSRSSSSSAAPPWLPPSSSSSSMTSGYSGAAGARFLRGQRARRRQTPCCGNDVVRIRKIRNP